MDGFTVVALIIIGLGIYIGRCHLIMGRYRDELQRINIAFSKHIRDYDKYYSNAQFKAMKAELEKELSIREETFKDNMANELSIRKADLEKQFSDASIAAKSNLSAIPYFSKIIADFDTRGLDILAAQINWGSDQKRLKKVKSILEIKKDTAELIASYKEAEYQLAYALQMFPALEDFLASEYSPDRFVDSLELLTETHDNVRHFLSKEEYQSLSTAQRNQLALDRYWESHTRSRWQVGRDYEQYIGYCYSRKGYTIQYFGIENGLEDLGRDVIAKKQDQTLIIQCKYWSSKKMIREKHISQLYGTMIEYCFEHGSDPGSVHGILVTNITVSETAKRFAAYLGIEVVEGFQLGKYPCIKCNINQSDHSKIYHLPFDQQYDTCKIDAPREFYAMTVEEAEKAGFRRAYRWHGQE